MTVISLETCDLVTDWEFVWIFTRDGGIQIPMPEWLQMLDWWEIAGRARTTNQ